MASFHRSFALHLSLPIPRPFGGLWPCCVYSDRFADAAVQLAAIALENDVANSTLLTIRGTEGLRNPRSVAQGANLLFAGITSAASSGVWGWNAYVKPFMLTSNRTFVNLQV